MSTAFYNLASQGHGLLCLSTFEWQLRTSLCQMNARNICGNKTKKKNSKKINPYFMPNLNNSINWVCVRLFVSTLYVWWWSLLKQGALNCMNKKKWNRENMHLQFESTSASWILMAHLVLVFGILVLPWMSFVHTCTHLFYTYQPCI